MRVLLHPLVKSHGVILRVAVPRPDLAHRLALQPAEPLGRRLGVVDVGGRHQHGPERPQAVHHEMTLPALDILGIVAAPLLAAGGRVDRRAVDAGGGAGVVGLLLRSDLLAQRVVERVQGAVAPPAVEVAPDGALGGEVAGEVPPRAAGAGDVEDGVEDVPRVDLARSPAAGADGVVGLNQGPLLVGEVAGVVVVFHTRSTSLGPQLFPLWDSLLTKPSSQSVKTFRAKIQETIDGSGSL